jgi:hypothetical protein
MSYVFNAIEDALNGAAPSSGKQDIFNAGATAGPGGAAAGPADNTTRGIDDAPGAGNTGGATAGGETTAKQDTETTPAGANSAFLDRNKAEGSGLATQLRTKLQGNSDALQKEADDYYTTASGAGKAMNFDTPNIDKALSGDKDQTTALKSRLGATAPVVDSFKSNTSVKVPGLDDIQTDAGLQNYLTQSGSANYTKGQAGLDAMLLGQNSDFVKSRADLLRGQEALGKKQQTYQTDYSKKAQDQAAADFTAGTGAIKSYLGNQESTLDAAAKARMDAYNADIANLRSGGDAEYSKAQAAEALKALIANAHGAAPDLEQYLGQVNDVDAGQFFSAGSGANDINQFYDQPSADKYNMIESLLGGAGTRLPVGGLGARESFNASGYQGAVQTKAQALKDAADKAAADKAAAEAAAQAQAQAEAAAAQKAKDDAAAAAAAKQKAESNPQNTEYWNPATAPQNFNTTTQSKDNKNVPQQMNDISSKVADAGQRLDPIKGNPVSQAAAGARKKLKKYGIG